MNPRGIEPRACAVEKERGLPALFFCWIEIAVVAVLLCAFWYLNPKESSGNLGGLRRIKIHNCLFGELEIFELDIR
jgi:hypothetical protein